MEGNSIASLENLCKIFEMRIKLDKERAAKTQLDIFNDYEKYSKKIDTIYNNQFQKELKPLISPAITLEKEEDRLKKLIKLLEDRLDKRIELEDRFYSTTGKYITGLQMIVSEDELEDKKERLSLVTRYLETSTEIENVIESINRLKDSLSIEENKKDSYEEKNKTMEDELYSSFMAIIKNDDYFRSISEEDISSQLEEIRSKVSEAEETLDITKESIGSLITNGLDDDYASYVEEAEKSYFNFKNRELILKIYKLVVDFEDDFKLMCSKRERIGKLIEEQKSLRESLTISTVDILSPLEKVLFQQNTTLDNEREVLENIANYTSRIKFKEERLEELNEANSSVEVLSILREYGLIDTYDSKEELKEEVLEELEQPVPQIAEIVLPKLEEKPVIEEVYDPYRIVEVKDYPKTLNVGLAKLKGESVREKVSKKLNPKTEEPTFEDITSNIIVGEVMPEPVQVVPVEEPKVESSINIETPIPVTTIPVLNSDVSNSENKIEESPNFEIKLEPNVWELPEELEPKQVTFEESNINTLPLWNMLPVENVPKQEIAIEETKNNNMPIETEDIDKSNMFWIPVSESKLETKDFPSLNIPFSSGTEENNSFSFPEYMNKGE